MNGFPVSAEEFYRLRDDRTNLCCGDRAYQHTACVLHVSPAAATRPEVQVMVTVAANLLSRWCRKVTLVMPPMKADPALGLGGDDLGELVIAQMRDADPFGQFRLGERDDQAYVTLDIGEGGTVPNGPNPVHINASGWLAAISREEPTSLPVHGEPNWVGAIAAACLGVAQVFKIAVGMPTSQYLRDGVLDMFQLAWSSDRNQSPWPADLNIGKILMVGAGSVGSAAAYCMRLAGLAGALTIVDKDLVEVENFNRSPLFGRSAYGLNKAKTVEAFLNGSSLTSLGVPLWWNDFLLQHTRSSIDFDVWLPLANEFEVRQAIQHNVPPLMIHASTGNNWGVNHGRHIPGRDDCLVDRFPADTAPSFTCATGPIPTSAKPIDAALPFASLFAGLLITADLVRAQLPGYPQIPNFALFDWYGPLNVIQAWDRIPREGCICKEQGSSFHRLFNAGTKHWHLFGT